VSLYKALALKSIGVEVWMESTKGECHLFDENSFLLDDKWSATFVGVDSDVEADN